jgi:arabinan endo-1,5-alpha-L-arabinosidase
MQEAAPPPASWPKGPIAVDLGDSMIRPRQLWTIAPAPGGGARGTVLTERLDYP